MRLSPVACLGCPKISAFVICMRVKPPHSSFIGSSIPRSSTRPSALLQAQELRNNALARYLEAADEVLQEEGEEAPPPQGEGDQLLLAAALVDGDATVAAGSAAGAIAPRGSVFASMSLAGPTFGSVRLGHAARVVLNAFSQAAKQMPAARPRLARPARGGVQKRQ
jgi:hypothetical protein